MADEGAAAVATQDPPVVEGGSEGSGSEPVVPSLAERLAWDTEANGELPAELGQVGLDDIRTFMEEQRTSAADEARTAASTAQRGREQQERDRQAQQATAQEDVTWWEGIRAELADPEKAAAAAVTLEQNGDRVARAAAEMHNRSYGESQRRVLTDFFTLAHRELQATEYGDLFPLPGTPEFTTFAMETLAEHDGKGGLLAYAVAYGRGLGREEALTQGRDEGQRTARAELGAEGAPQIGGASTASTTGVRFGDEAWVRRQIEADPGWRTRTTDEKDGYGRPKTNNRRVIEAMQSGRRPARAG